jgi:LPXTG-motif cell wall-anchored protein
MQHIRITSVVLAILVVTALSAAGASAQSIPQQAQSGDVAMPTKVTGDDPVNISSNFETGNKQISESHRAGPQPKERRQRGERGTEYDATPTEAAPTEAAPTEAAPTEAAPSSGNPTKSGGSGSTPAPMHPSQSEAKAELPKTGGSSVASLFALGAGVLLVGGGLLARRISK